MSKKINNKILAIILVVLTAIFLITNYLKDNQRSTHIDTNLIMIDTSIVSYISIYPKSGNKEKVIFTKQTYGWEVESNNIKSSLRKGSSANILSELAKMKIKRLVAKTEEKWEKYQLTEELATHLMVEEKGNRKTLDIYIGKTKYQQPSQVYNQFGGRQQFTGSTFVRLGDSPKIYEINGFLSMTFNRDFNSWRNNEFITTQKENITQINLQNNGSSFSLTKNDSLWIINNEVVDSTKIAQYLNLLANQQNTAFADNYKQKEVPDYILTITSNNMNTITVNCFEDALSNNYYLESSLNPNVFFRSDSKGIFKELFVDIDYFIEK